MFYDPFFGTKKCSEKGNKFEVWFFSEISPKIAKLPPLLLDNPILDKHKRKEYIIVLSGAFLPTYKLVNRVPWYHGTSWYHRTMEFGTSQLFLFSFHGTTSARPLHHV